jgi:transcriptional/translational regulatory protein YebC/TACO1
MNSELRPAPFEKIKSLARPRNNKSDPTSNQKMYLAHRIERARQYPLNAHVITRALAAARGNSEKLRAAGDE